MKQAVGEGRVMSTMTETTDQSTNTTPPAVVASAVKLRWSVPEKMEAWFSCREFVDVSVS